jgi:hypothetical protein
MKQITIILSFILIFGSIKSLGQELDEYTFDFWVGIWEVGWVNPDGSRGLGTNHIVRTLNKKVIQENFKDPNTNYEGTSISVYNPNTKKWHQAWADSDGSFYNFEGDIINGEPVFKTKMVVRNGEQIIQRMVFKEIQEDSFIWIWEGTKNNGESWNEIWKINYKRK